MITLGFISVPTVRVALLYPHDTLWTIFNENIVTYVEAFHRVVRPNDVINFVRFVVVPGYDDLSQEELRGHILVVSLVLLISNLKLIQDSIRPQNLVRDFTTEEQVPLMLPDRRHISWP
jgi:hypothetical protein